AAGPTEGRGVLLDPGNPRATAEPAVALSGRNGIGGVVIGLASGLPDRRRLDLATRALDRGLRVWLHWPDEQAVEHIDRERLQSLRRHRHAVVALEKVGRRAHTAMKAWERIRPRLRL